MTYEQLQYELEKVDRLHAIHEQVEDAPLWLQLLGWADCEVEKKMLREEYLAQL